MKRPRVLRADDHQMLAEALKSVVEPRCEVVGTVSDGRALLEAAAGLQEVASELKITTRTVAGHKYAVMELLQLKTNADLVQYAIEHGIISLHRTSLPSR